MFVTLLLPRYQRRFSQSKNSSLVTQWLVGRANPLLPFNPSVEQRHFVAFRPSPSQTDAKRKQNIKIIL